MIGHVAHMEKVRISQNPQPGRLNEMGSLRVDGEFMFGTEMRYCSEKWIQLPHGSSGGFC